MTLQLSIITERPHMTVFERQQETFIHPPHLEHKALPPSRYSAETTKTPSAETH